MNITPQITLSIFNLEEKIRNALQPAIKDNLENLFNQVNTKVAEISQTVGKTPSEWNPGIYSMIKTLSEKVMLPIAAVILALVMTLELYQMIMDKNDFQNGETVGFVKWIIKCFLAAEIVSHMWDITMASFTLGQSVVNQAASFISPDSASLDFTVFLKGIDMKMTEMELGPLVNLWLLSFFVRACMWILQLCIFIICAGRMIEIYCVTSVAPIPLATIMNREEGHTGKNYFRNLFALGFQAFLIMVCVAIYGALVKTITYTDDLNLAISTCVGYTALLCFSLFKTGSLSKSIFGAR